MPIESVRDFILILTTLHAQSLEHRILVLAIAKAVFPSSDCSQSALHAVASCVQSRRCTLYPRTLRTV